MLTTLGKDGYPHSIPIGYFRIDETVYMGCRADTQKTKNIERNPKVSLGLESGTTMQDIKGVLIQGDAEVVTEPGRLLELQREAGRQRGTAEADLLTSANVGSAYIAVTSVKVISWDYGTG
jgi:nitroimidazol reductase NimA-like FMN-containing flavoprotein (pyridoxamine 5'-phosphate oxidase superfamily)